MTASINLASLLQARESESLDFKSEFHENNATLLHDTLCLANAYADADRYLVFGVTNQRSVVGVAGDRNRKTNANLQDFLRKAHCNRIPTCVIETVLHGGSEVDVLTIKNRPDKPFFVTKDFAFQGKCVRNGVVYTRLGDTNIPMNSSAPEDHIELMWRERFGLGLSPLERMHRLLDDPANWRKRGDSYIYCVQFPEFTIVDGEKCVDQFSEEWTRQFPDKSAWSFVVELRYHAMLLDTALFVSCDGGRYRVPMPERETGPNGKARFTISKSSVEWKLSQMYRQYYPLDTTYTMSDVEFLP